MSEQNFIWDESVSEELLTAPILSLNDIITCCYSEDKNNQCLYLNRDKLLELAKSKIL